MEFVLGRIFEVRDDHDEAQHGQHEQLHGSHTLCTTICGSRVDDLTWHDVRERRGREGGDEAYGFRCTNDCNEEAEEERHVDGAGAENDGKNVAEISLLALHFSYERGELEVEAVEQVEQGDEQK